MDEPTPRQAIKDVALELLVRHGYRGASFGDIADALGMTRANIHYHFGSKQALIEEVLADYVAATLASIRADWQTPGLGFAERAERMLALSVNRYRHYNPEGNGGPWSLISRLRQDAALLTPRGRADLSRFSTELVALLTEALAAERDRGGFVADTPVAAIAQHLALIADNAPAATLEADGLAHLAALYRGFVAIVERAYSRR